MSNAMRWAVGIVMGLTAFLGLVMASQAEDDVFYLAGLLFFGFGVLFDYALIATAGDDREASQAGD